MRLRPSHFAVFALAISLAACGGADDSTEKAAYKDPKAPTVELSPIQQASFERLNRDEVREGYASIKGELSKDAAESKVPTQEEIEFSWLDHDSNGKLSVAEFALFQMGANAAPELNDQQLSDVASHFFANDVDGDQALSESEFASASGRPAPEEEASDAG